MGVKEWRIRVAATALWLGLVGCAPAIAPPSAEPVHLQAAQAGWVLEADLPSTEFDSMDAIDLRTTLTWTGAEERASVWGSGMGVVTFLYGELGGAGRSMGGAMTADCRQFDFARGVPVAVPPGKGWAAVGDDPNIAFYQAWSADPALHLPVGRWRIVVATDGLLAPCAADAAVLKLSIPIEITIR